MIFISNIVLCLCYALLVGFIVNRRFDDKFIPGVFNVLITVCVFFSSGPGIIRQRQEYKDSKPVLIEDVMVVNDKFIINRGQFVLDVDDNLIIRTGDSVRLVAVGDSIKYFNGGFWQGGVEWLSFITPDGVCHYGK